MKYLQTMVCVNDLDTSLCFYRDALGLDATRRRDVPTARFAARSTRAYLAAQGQSGAAIDLTCNWDPKPSAACHSFGHAAYAAEPWTSMPNAGAW